MESKARGVFDAEDPNIQSNFEVMVTVANLLWKIGRLPESVALAKK